MRVLAGAVLCLVALGSAPAEARHHGHHRGRLHHGAGRIAFQPQVHGMSCLRPTTRAMIGQLTARIGPIQITSTCGGRHAHNSQHYRGNAIDFRPSYASVGQTLAVLRSMPIVGGIGSYSGGLIHADVGERTAHWQGRTHGRYASLRLRRHTARHHRRRWG